MEPISLAGHLAEISEHWSPRTVTAVNDYEVRLVRVRGEFIRHQHPDSDEFFLVLDGELTIELADGAAVLLGRGEAFVVPAGAYHRPLAHVETSVLLFEPRAVPHRGVTFSKA
jgi:mannose-6-phosphate isomerase-like protein (cupin superfamily)